MRARAVVASVLVAAVAGPAPAQGRVTLAPRSAPSVVVVAGPEEPGVRLEVSGVVLAVDGRTPVPHASVYVYQTDARGYYRPDDAMGNRDPRLKGLLRTDAHGRYSFRTIRPASYPGQRVPQHIHYQVAAEGHGSRVFEIVFDDDPYVDERIRQAAARPGSFYALVKVEGGRVQQDVVLPGP